MRDLPQQMDVQACITFGRVSRICSRVYKIMRGLSCLGAAAEWDTHGLPVEIEVEKQLGFNNKQQIEDTA